MRIQILGLLLIAISTLQAQTKSSPLLESYVAFTEMADASPYHTSWVPLGPAVNGARAEAVQAHPDQPGTLYVAFGSGGLWKSVNNGLTWTPVFQNRASLGIGDFALAPSNPDIIYVGTGESLRKARNFTMPGTGIYRSNDGGHSWTHLGLEDSWHIGEIAVHPTNPEVVVVSVLGQFWSESEARGIYRTEDGGATWKQVLHIDATTGANDIVISPTNPNRMYCTTWEFKAAVRGDRNFNNTGSNGGVFVSDDMGKTWKSFSKGLPTSKKYGRSSVAVSATNPDKAYVLIDNQKNTAMETAEVYKTTDGGRSWSKTHKEPLRIFSVVGWYFTDIYVNPHDDDEIYTLGVRMANSEDGGKTFSYVNGDVRHLNSSMANGMHLDHCELWINPENPENLLLANDGGLYESHDGGTSWLHFNNIPTGEFYDITLGPGSPYTIYGGVQDDATVYGPPSRFNQSLDDPWKYLWIDPWNGGDGCITLVDPDDPNTVYYSAQEGAARRLDMTTGETTGIRPRLPKNMKAELRFNFITPYFISPYDSKTLYHGGNLVFKSSNRGDTWDIISPDLTASSDPEKKSVSAGALVESELQKGLLYYGTDMGAFWTTDNDGETWKEYSSGLPNAYIRSIHPSTHEKGRVYVALSGINYDDLTSYLFVSEDHGKSWKKISSNLPNEPVNKVLEDPQNSDILYVGGYRGVYISYSRGQSWHLMGKGMPMASVADLEIDTKTQDLVAATHGRGIFKINLESFRALPSGNMDVAQLFISNEVTRPARILQGAEPPNDTIEPMSIQFWAPNVGRAVLKISDEKKEIFSVEFDAEYGLNEYSWDLILSEEKSDMPYFTQYKKYITGGDYNLSLNVDGVELEGTFTVKSR